jgi:hypothetical protein
MIGMHLITGTGLALCLLASFVGWGRLVAAALRTGGKVGMPWEAAWGTCAVMLLGGILNAARLVSEPVAVGVVVVGCALFFGFSGMRDAVAVARRWMAFPMSLQLLLSVAAAFGAFTIFFSLYPIRWEPNDDALAYAVFPRQMLEAGWLNEPFSVRRILGYGGYQFLQALILAPLTSFELALLDRGVMTVLGSAALACYLRRRIGTSRAVALLSGIAFIAFPLLRNNLSPTSILSFLSLALLETFHVVREQRGWPMWRGAALLGLVAAGMVSVRVTAVGVVGSLLAMLVAVDRSRWRESAGLLAGAGAFAAFALTPWAWTLMQSSNTPLYPIVPGNYNRQAVFSEPMPPAALARYLWECLSLANVHFLLLLTAAGVVARCVSREVVCYVLCAVITAVVTMVSFNLWDAWGHLRFHGPFTTVAFHLVIGSWLARHRWFAAEGFAFRTRFTVPAPVRLAAVLAAFAVVLPVLVRGRALGEGSSGGALDFDATLRARVKAEYPMALASAESYAAALAMIPTGSTVLSAVDSPFLLDQHQHTIVCIDEVGTVSPPPGLPLGGSPEALEAYLRRCSIDYVIFVRPENAMALYRTEVWQAPAVEIWKRRAPYFLWFFDSLEKLAATDRLVFENRAAAVLSLR